MFYCLDTSRDWCRQPSRSRGSCGANQPRDTLRGVLPFNIRGMTIATALGWQQSGSSCKRPRRQTRLYFFARLGSVVVSNLMWSAGNVVGFAVVKIQMIFSEGSHLPTSPYRITRRCVRQTFSGGSREISYHQTFSRH
jgi:hypothetical protein